MRRRKRMVRLHLRGDLPSIEGIFTGFWAGHYVIRTPSVVASEQQTLALDGQDARVPKEQVMFVQVLSA